MNLYIDIDNEEYLAFLENKDGAKNWAIKIPHIGIILTFTEKDGFITELKPTPKINITTNKAALLERIQAIVMNTLQNENDGFEEPNQNVENQVIESPYNADDIKVRRDYYSVREIYTKIKEHDIDLNPNFQRHLVWDATQKSRLIESILLGIPLPVFYFAEDKEGTFHVIDGIQRLNTITDFMDNKFALKNLEHLGECKGKYFKPIDKVTPDKVLEGRFLRRLGNAQLNVNVIEAASPEKVKYDIFRRINEGGKPLNQQEIRNSLAKEKTRKILQTLVKSEDFILATGTISDTRMGAQEMVLRYIGFYLETKGKLTYTGDMNDFLDITNELMNKMTTNELDIIKKIFLQAIHNCYHLFGQYCFRKYLPEQFNSSNKRLLNKSLFITWMITMSKFSTIDLKKRIDFESFALILAEKLKSDLLYFSYVTSGTNDVKNLKYAFKVADELISKKMNL